MSTPIRLAENYKHSWPSKIYDLSTPTCSHVVFLCFPTAGWLPSLQLGKIALWCTKHSKIITWASLNHAPFNIPTLLVVSQKTVQNMSISLDVGILNLGPHLSNTRWRRLDARKSLPEKCQAYRSQSLFLVAKLYLEMWLLCVEERCYLPRLA